MPLRHRRGRPIPTPTHPSHWAFEAAGNLRFRATDFHLLEGEVFAALRRAVTDASCRAPRRMVRRTSIAVSADSPPRRILPSVPWPTAVEVRHKRVSRFRPSVVVRPDDARRRGDARRCYRHPPGRAAHGFVHARTALSCESLIRKCFAQSTIFAPDDVRGCSSIPAANGNVIARTLAQKRLSICSWHPNGQARMLHPSTAAVPIATGHGASAIAATSSAKPAIAQQRLSKYKVRHRSPASFHTPESLTLPPRPSVSRGSAPAVTDVSLIR